MFKSYIVEDYVTLTVSEYIRDSGQTLIEKLSDKYINKVLYGFGLCVLLDGNLIKCEPRVLPNEGCANYKVHFKLLVFSPKVNEVLQGKIVFFDKCGITISVKFFSDIRVIPQVLSSNYGYDSETRCWYHLDENHNKCPYRLHDNIKFRVLDIVYNRSSGGKKDMNTIPMLIIARPET